MGHFPTKTAYDRLFRPLNGQHDRSYLYSHSYPGKFALGLRVVITLPWICLDLPSGVVGKALDCYTRNSGFNSQLEQFFFLFPSLFPPFPCYTYNFFQIVLSTFSSCPTKFIICPTKFSFGLTFVRSLLNSYFVPCFGVWTRVRQASGAATKLVWNHSTEWV